MEQEKINKLIEFNWTTLGIKKIDPETYELWKEFSELINFEAKTKQSANIYLNHIKSFSSKQQFLDALNEKSQDIANDYESIVFDQLCVIVLQIADNYLNSSKINNIYIRLEKFFNFIWFCLYPLFFCKSFLYLFNFKNELFDNLINELSNAFYGKIVDQNTITLEKINTSSRFLFLLVGNLLDSIREK